MRFLRQLRAELRKGATPVTAATMTGIALLTGVVQYASQGRSIAPSLFDNTGALAIAILQHGTLSGFVVAGILAGQMTGAETASSSILITLTGEPRRSRVMITKTTAHFTLMWVSTLITALTLTITRQLMYTSEVISFQDQTGTTWSEVTSSALRASVVLIFLSAVTTGLAVWSSSTLTPAVIATGVFIMGIMLHGISNTAANPQIGLVEYTPHQWVVKWLRLDIEGRWTDYFAAAPPSFTSSLQSGILLIVFAAGAAALTSSVLFNRSISKPKGNQ